MLAPPCLAGVEPAFFTDLLLLIPPDLPSCKGISGVATGGAPTTAGAFSPARLTLKESPIELTFYSTF